MLSAEEHQRAQRAPGRRVGAGHDGRKREIEKARETARMDREVDSAQTLVSHLSAVNLQDIAREFSKMMLLTLFFEAFSTNVLKVFRLSMGKAPLTCNVETEELLR